nr:adenylate/guanylate cyclase domain-containing protein [Sneathiella limimaris]
MTSVGLSALIVFMLQVPKLDQLDRLDLDFLHLTESLLPFPPDPVSTEVAVIAIDEQTYASPPFAGLPKVMWTPQMADVQNKVLQSGASLFVWDIILPTSASNYAADRRIDTPLLQSYVKWGRNEGKLLLGQAQIGRETIAPYRAHLIAAGGADNLVSLDLQADVDGVIRSLPVKDLPSASDPSYTEETLLHLAPAALKRLRQISTPIFPSGAAIKFSNNPGTIPVFSFQDLYHCQDKDYFANNFAGRIVVLGAILQLEDRKLAGNRFVGMRDFEGAPTNCKGESPNIGDFARSYIPGVLLQATALQNLLDGSYVSPISDTLRVIICFLIGLAAFGIALKASVAVTAVCIVLGSLFWISGATIAFQMGVKLPLLDGQISMILAVASGFLFRFRFVDQERKTVRESLTRYLDANVLEDILDHGKAPKLGGEQREVTVLFSDIAGFTSLSERLAPSELVDFLNTYFEIVDTEVKAHGGIIERFIGDAVIALFGAPVDDANHAPNAVRCSLAIIRKLDQRFNGLNVDPTEKIVTRIGLNSGIATVGNVGAKNRFAYTAMGDCVNVAARLESANKQFGTVILVGEDCRTKCGEAFEFRKIETVRVVGREEPLMIFEPLGEGDSISEETRGRKALYEEALSKLRAGEFGTAQERLEGLALKGDVAAQKALLRLEELKNMPDLSEWDGVINLSAK